MFFDLSVAFLYALAYSRCNLPLAILSDQGKETTEISVNVEMNEVLKI